MFLLSPPPINFLSHLRLQLQQPRDLQHQILQKRCLSLPRLSIGFSWFQSVFVISELCLVRILPFFVAIDALFIRRPSGTVVLYLGTLRRLLLCQRSTSIHAWTPKSVLLFHYFSPAFLICFILQKWPPAFHINFSVFLFHLSVSLWVARLHSCSLVPSFLDLYCQIHFFLLSDHRPLPTSVTIALFPIASLRLWLLSHKCCRLNCPTSWLSILHIYSFPSPHALKLYYPLA